MRAISKLYSCDIFVWFCHQGNAGLIKMSCKVAFLLFVLEEAMGVIFSLNIGKNQKIFCLLILTTTSHYIQNKSRWIVE